MQPWKITLRSYLSGAWHFRWVGVALAWGLCLTGWTVLVFVPNQFQAVAKIYVDTNTMMTPLLKGLTVNTDPQQQVSVMLNTLLTRPNLEQVVQLTEPSGKNLSNADLARRVESLKDHVSLKPLGSKNLYEIAFTDRNPNKALSVAQTLLSIFVDSNIGTKRKDFQGAQSFLDDKVAQYETLVREAEQRRAAFRQANLDVLTNAVTPETAQAAVEKMRQDLGAAQARLSSLQAQLAAIPKVIYVDGPGPLIVNGGASLGRGSPLQRLAEAKQGLIELRSKYTDDYPEVKTAKREVIELQNELAAAPPVGQLGSGTQSIPNPVYTQTQGKLSDAQTDVAFQRHRYSDTLAALENAKKMSRSAIEVNRKFADLDRDYDLVHKTYQDLLARRESARISQAVNDQQSTIDVRIVEAPKKAPFPSAPNRPIINSIILLAGVLGGLAATILLGMNAGRFYVKDQLAAEFDYPTIGVVTRLKRPEDDANQRRSYRMVGTSVLMLVGSFAMVLILSDATLRVALRNLL